MSAAPERRNPCLASAEELRTLGLHADNFKRWYRAGDRYEAHKRVPLISHAQGPKAVSSDALRGSKS